MAMFDVSEPQYRALVVENERELRLDLVSTIEELDIGVSVVEDVGTFKVAKGLIEKGDFDLLITDINLKDDDEFIVGDEDGTELGNLAYQLHEKPVLFLTGYANSDPKVVPAASECKPIGFIEKHSGALTKQTETLLLMAINRLEIERRDKEYASQLKAALAFMGDCIVYIDHVGVIRNFNTEFASLLGVDGESIIGQHWSEAIKAVTVGDGEDWMEAAFGSAITSGVQTRIEAMELESGGGEHVLVSASISPCVYRGQPCRQVIFKALEDKEAGDLAQDIEELDVIAMVGLSGIALSADFRGSDLGAMMLDLRTAAQGQLRSVDLVATPIGTTLPVVIRETSMTKAGAILESLLLSLSRIPASYGQRIEVSVGMASRHPGMSGIGAIARARRALAAAQLPDCEDRIIDADDLKAVLGVEGSPSPMNLNEDPILEALERLTEFRPEQVDSDEDLARCLSTSVSHFEGFEQMAVFKRLGDGSFEDFINWSFAEGGHEIGVSALNPSVLPSLNNLESLGAAQIETVFDQSTGSGVVFVGIGEAGEPSAVIAFVGDAEKLNVEQWSGDLSRALMIANRHVLSILHELPSWSTQQAPQPVDDGDLHSEYVRDDMGGAVQQAVMHLNLDVPIAIVGPRGVGKTYVAKRATEDWGSKKAPTILAGEEFSKPSSMLELMDILVGTEKGAIIYRDFQRASPRVQDLLAKALSSHMVTVEERSEVLPQACRHIFILPKSPEAMEDSGELRTRLASVISAAQVDVSPLTGASKSILRWAKSILLQECLKAGKSIRGFTSDAEVAMERHPWHGNLSEMRSLIADAVAQTDRGYLTPVDLNVFSGIGPRGSSYTAKAESAAEDRPVPTAREEAEVAIAEVIHFVVQKSTPPPIGTWLWDEAVMAAMHRFRHERSPARAAAKFLGVVSRTVDRAQVAAVTRKHERSAAPFWGDVRRKVYAWIDAEPVDGDTFESQLNRALMLQLMKLEKTTVQKNLAAIAGVSIPTFIARKKEVRASLDNPQDDADDI